MFVRDRKPSSDLLGLNLFQSPTVSSASTPTGAPSGGHPYAPLQSPTQPSVGSPAPPSSSRYAGLLTLHFEDIFHGLTVYEALSGLNIITFFWLDLGDLFSEVGEIQPALPPKQSRQTPTPTQGSIVIPRPPSRRGEVGRC